MLARQKLFQIEFFKLIVILLFGLGNAEISAAYQLLPEHGSSTLPANAIVHTSERIEINVTRRTIVEVLQAVQNISGIRFEIAEELVDTPMENISITARHWRDAVEQLLQAFDRVEIVGKEKKLQRVIVVNERSSPAEIGDAIPDILPQNVAPPPDVMAFSQNDNKGATPRPLDSPPPPDL